MKENRALLFFAAGGMDLSWLYAWATFMTVSVLHRSFPFPEAVGSFVLAAVLTHFCTGRGWRIIYIFIIEAAGFVPLLIRVTRIFMTWSPSFASQTWLQETGTNALGAQEYCIFLLLLVWVVAFWGGGMRLSWRPTDYLTFCSRFDRGLVAFFILFLAKFLFHIRGDLNLAEPVSEYLIFPFLIFSLLGIGLSRTRTAAQKDFLPGYQGIGVILTFTVVVLLIGAGLVFFFLPYLTAAAETGYHILKIAAVPVGYILLKILRFIFGDDFSFTEKPPEKPPPPPDMGTSSHWPWWLELLGKILTYAVWVLLALVFLTIIAVSVYFFYKWLLSKSPVERESESPRHLFLLWVERLRRFLNSFRSWILRKIRGYKRAVHIYAALLRWGRRSGLSHLQSETPAEYGARLKRRFPVVDREIESIIEAFNEEVYRERPIGENRLAATVSAWRNLRSPAHWPRRLKNWFLRPRDQT